MKTHPVGEITPRSVLDVGRGCPLKCSFCYYIHQPMVGYITPAQATEFLQHVRRLGKTHCDITGGEPSLMPHIVDVVRFGAELGLKMRMITSGQYLYHGRKVGPELIEAGIESFQFSIHGLPETHDALVHAPHDCAYQRIGFSIQEITRAGIPYDVNTVITGENFKELPEMARDFLARSVIPRRVNLIHFNRYYEWTAEDASEPVESGTEASFDECAEYVCEVIDILDTAHVTVNARYFPLCALPERYRSHIVGMRHLLFDPSEQDNLGESYESAIRGAEDKVAKRNEFGFPCLSCSLRPICDGYDRGYAKAHGWAHATPERLGPRITDPLYYRRDYELGFRL